jgi:hypothetical protein
MNDFKKDIQNIKKSQKEYVLVQNKIRDLVKKLEKSVDKYVHKKCKESFNVDISFTTVIADAYLTNNWNPSIYFNGLDHLDHYQGSFYSVVCTCEYNNLEYKQTVAEVISPVSIKDFKNFIKKIQKTTGIHCYLNDSYVVEYTKKKDANHVLYTQME